MHKYICILANINICMKAYSVLAMLWAACEKTLVANCQHKLKIWLTDIYSSWSIYSSLHHCSLYGYFIIGWNQFKGTPDAVVCWFCNV